jgi:hypothetical protein
VEADDDFDVAAEAGEEVHEALDRETVEAIAIDLTSGSQEGFGVFLGYGEEFEGGLARATGALLPATDGVGAYVQVG